MPELTQSIRPKIRLHAERPVAYSSPDYLTPWGTRRDNSRNWRFNQKVYQLFAQRNEPLRILDMGCSGGGFVKDCLDDGCLAVGLEGSDYSWKYKRAEWATIPDYLFTCDVTGKFDLEVVTGEKSESLKFDVVTSWELIEHIAEPDLEKVATNVKKHLAPGGLWIMSVSPNEEVINGTVLHQTVQNKPWWVKKFQSLGLEHQEPLVSYFNTQYIRGPKFQAPGSFHLILSANPNQVPAIPSEGLKERLFDLWHGSLIQRVLKLAIVGTK